MDHKQGSRMNKLVRIRFHLNISILSTVVLKHIWSRDIKKKSRIRETSNLSMRIVATRPPLLGSFFDRHFWGPLLAATFGRHFWGPFLIATFGVHFGRPFWGPLLTTTFGVLFWPPLLGSTFDRHFWGPLLTTNEFWGVDQWEAGIWSCDLRANERPQKKIHEKGTDRYIN